MKQGITILLIFISMATIGQKNQTVDLQWKIAENEKLNYLTVMNEIDTSSLKMDFGKLFQALSDSTNNGLEESKCFFDKINKMLQNQDYVMTLTNKNNGVINIVMTAKNSEPVKENGVDTSDSEEVEIAKMMQLLTQGVMLRGSVYATGGIHSFWVKSAQRNLIALFFELPTKPVKVGEKWSLDINFIANEQNFDCDTSYKINEVTLVEIKEIENETIAVLKYNIVEYVKGNFNAFSFFDSREEQTETMMKFSHQGISEFSIDRGRWVTYDGIMSVETTGIMTANKKTKFTLIDDNK